MGETLPGDRDRPRSETVQERAERVHAVLAAYSPSDCLTVGEAGRLLGLSEARIRRRIQSGLLLHETGKRAGREVCLIRVLDLRTAFGSPPSDSEGEEGAGQADAPGSGGGTDLRTVQQERDDLRERCDDLNTRLALLAADRPATAVQELPWRDLETVIARRFVWWRRPATWGWAASVAMLAWLWDGADHDRVLAQGRLDTALVQHQLAQERLAAQVGEWRDQARVTQLELDRDRQVASLDRTRFEERILAARTEAQNAQSQVREDRLRFEGDRQRWADLLAESQRDLRSQGALWRAEIENSSNQQQRFQAELAKRDQVHREEQARAAEEERARIEREAQMRAQQAALVAELEGQVHASRSQTEQLQDELQRMASLRGDQEARIAAGLAALEQMRADAAASERAEEIRAGAKTIGQWLIRVLPHIHGELLRDARGSDSGDAGGDSEGIS